MTKKTKKDVYQEVTDQVIAALESGVAPWECPWMREGAHRNAVTNNRYRGINTLITWMVSKEAGYTSAKWLTFNQAKTLGGMVRKGEKATTLIAYNLIKLDKDGKRLPMNAPAEKVDRTVPFIKGIPVFNIEQVDGLPEPDKVEGINDEDTLFAEAEALIENYGIEVRKGGDKAYYSPIGDYIGLPDAKRFHGESAFGHYWATAFHELIHSTGHPNRLDRLESMGVSFGNESYAKEELVAELGAAFMCAEFGVTGELNHADYIGSWLKVLKNDKKFIVQAASKAQQAADFLMEFAPKPQIIEGEGFAEQDAMTVIGGAA